MANALHESPDATLVASYGEVMYNSTKVVPISSCFNVKIMLFDLPVKSAVGLLEAKRLIISTRLHISY